MGGKTQKWAEAEPSTHSPYREKNGTSGQKLHILSRPVQFCLIS